MQIIDENNLAIIAIATIFLQILYFTLTCVFKVEKVSDFAAGSNFVLIALLSFLLSQVC